MNIAIIFAGGKGSRMKISGPPKQFLNICGEPVIIRTLKHFDSNPEIDAIVLVIIKEYLDLAKDLIKKYDLIKVKSIVPGGTTGQESIHNGLLAAKDLSTSGDDIVLIHDGVRPIIESDLISRCIASTKSYGSAISCVPAHETTALTNGDFIDSVTNRDTTFIARAPQCFLLNDLLSWHNLANQNSLTNFTDSCSMMMHFSNKKPHIVTTIPENIKITTILDYYLLRSILDAQNDTAALGINLNDSL